MTSLEFVEFADFSGGMNVALPVDEIADNECSILQDILPGYAGGSLQMRGRVDVATSASGSTFNPGLLGAGSAYEPHGMFTATTTGGVQRIGFCGTLASTGHTWLQAVADDFSSTSGNLQLAADYANNGTLPAFSASPRLGGGTFIGLSDGYEQIYSNRHLAIWNGASKPTYSTGTISYTQNSRTVTGVGTAWLTFAEPGMFIMHTTGFYLGMIVSVNSNTSITMDRFSPVTGATQAYSLKCFRGANINVGGGLISTATDSTTVVGSQTSFYGAGLWANTWNIYRASDGMYVGALSSVSTDTTLTLTGNAAIAMTNEAWYAIRTDLVNSIYFGTLTSTTALGFLTTTYAGRQWYANMSYPDIGFGSYVDSVWFSELAMPEVVNVSPSDGNRIQVSSTTQSPNTGIRGFMGTNNGILVAKDHETHVILGDDPDNFSRQKIVDDGCLNCGTVCGWSGGVVWAGWDGIWYWDGASPKNITLDKLGDYYKKLTNGFRENSSRAWAFVHRDYYVLHIERLPSAPNAYYVTNASNPRSQGVQTDFVLCVHIPSGTVSTFTAFPHMGAIKYTGAALGEQTLTLIPAAAGSFSTPGPALYSVNNVFTPIVAGGVEWTNTLAHQTNGTWTLLTNPYVSPFVQTKAFDIGTPLVKKTWRSLMVHYETDVNMPFWIAPAIDPNFAPNPSPLPTFPASNNFSVAQTKFTRRSRKMLLQMTPYNSLGHAPENFTIKAFGLRYKNLPVGRV